MNRDFAEMLNALSDEGVEYLVVGAYTVAAHGQLAISTSGFGRRRRMPPGCGVRWNALEPRGVG